MFQYIQQISNTTTTAINGQLTLIGMYIAVDGDTQYSVDLTINFRENIVETMVQADNKALDNIVNHKDDTGITLAVNRNLTYAPNFNGINDSFTFHIISNKRIIIGDWVFSFDNLYGYRNGVPVFFDDVCGEVPQDNKLLVLGILPPSFSYSFKY